jgi:predicted nucleic acid-binding protein
MLAVFDTNIVIDALNGVIEADTEYNRYERVLISRITWMEVLNWRGGG